MIGGRSKEIQIIITRLVFYLKSNQPATFSDYSLYRKSLGEPISLQENNILRCVDRLSASVMIRYKRTKAKDQLQTVYYLKQRKKVS